MIDSFEFSKFAAGIITALLVIVGTRTAIEVAVHYPHSTPGFELPAPTEQPAAKEGAPAPAAFNPATVVAALPAAKAENGQGAFKKCAACHTGDKGGANKIGPNLWGLVDRKIASHAGFAYSDAMKAKQGNWTYQELAAFLHSPRTAVPGTKMVFAGIPDASGLADLLAYLRTLSDSPVPLP